MLYILKLVLTILRVLLASRLPAAGDDSLWVINTVFFSYDAMLYPVKLSCSRYFSQRDKYVLGGIPVKSQVTLIFDGEVFGVSSAINKYTSRCRAGERRNGRLYRGKYSSSGNSYEVIRGIFISALIPCHYNATFSHTDTVPGSTRTWSFPNEGRAYIAEQNDNT